jgi:aminobenzoyl-glutamate utilization protein B
MRYGRPVNVLWLAIGALGPPLAAQTDPGPWLDRRIQARAAEAARVAQQIWDFAEVGYQETQSSALLARTLRDAGFTVEPDVAGMPTAFIASYGSGRPVIGILAEFDALPGITQARSPERQVLSTESAGHACGHHLFGAGSVTAAIAVREWLEQSGTRGTIRVYGTPAEEGGAGKVYLVRDGAFQDVDAVLHWHPGDANSAAATSSLANKSAKFRFRGLSAHAAAAPEQGRSALDGVEAMNHMVNMLREHIPEDSRIHYVITAGGAAPNVIPDFAEVYYYVRHPSAEQAAANFERVVKAAEGAALGTGTTMDYEIIHGLYPLLINETLALVMHANLERVGGVTYTAEERRFAETLRASLQDPPPLESAERVRDFYVSEEGSGGSTDVGDVSWVVPTAGLRTATWVPGTPAHSWQAIAAGGMSIGNKGMLVAAKTLARTAADLFRDPSVIERAKAERARRVGPEFTYQALVGDRAPPLDYRNVPGR